MKVTILIALIAIIFVAGCTSTGEVTADPINDEPGQVIVNEPDKVIERLEFKGCNSLVDKTELDAVTSWNSVNTLMFTGFYGAIEMNCDYYESIGAFKYHVAYSLHVGGKEKLADLAGAWSQRNPEKETSEETILGVDSFSSFPEILAFVDKETGVVVWMRLDGGNLQITQADWNNLIEIGKVFDSKLN